jgi:hypothetical protein
LVNFIPLVISPLRLPPVFGTTFVFPVPTTIKLQTMKNKKAKAKAKAVKLMLTAPLEEYLMYLQTVTLKAS